VMLGALPQGQWRYLSADETFCPRARHVRHAMKKPAQAGFFVSCAMPGKPANQSSEAGSSPGNSTSVKPKRVKSVIR
ncbi:hypothetical protein NO113_19880, partial [Clostridioides difficile]|nr:hypothetical protein [Clostridioides difficile]